MADPTRYRPGYSYSGHQAVNPAIPLPAAQVDNDFAKLRQTTDETIDELLRVKARPDVIDAGSFGESLLASDNQETARELLSIPDSAAFGESLLAADGDDEARGLLALDDMVNLKWFGAVGNGIADDSDAVQAWLDFIVDNERLGYVPAGNFVLTTAIEKTLAAARSFGIVGAGIGASVFTVPAGNATGGIIIDAGAYWSSQFVARDFTILADGVSLGTGLAFTMTAGGNQHQRSVVVENVEAKGVDTTEDCFDIGMDFSGTWRPLIRGCVCGGPFGPGISSDLTDASPLFVATANLVLDDAYDWTVDNCHLWSAYTALRDDGTVSEAGRLTNTALVSCRVGLYRVRTAPEPIIWIENNHVNFRDVGFYISGAKLAVIRGNHPYNEDTGDEYSGTAYDVHLDNTERTIIASNVFHYDGAADRINIFVDTTTLGNDTLINGNIFSAQAASAIKVGAGATGTLICNNLYPGTITARYTDNSAACVILDYESTTGVLYQTNAGNAAGGPLFDLFRNSASPAASDILGILAFNGRDSAANKTLYGMLQAQIVDPANGSEDAAMQLWAMIAGTTTKVADFRAPSGSDTAGMLLLVNIGGSVSLKAVKLGAADSGGTGLRALVVDNS